jgi:hypothetical protein
MPSPFPGMDPYLEAHWRDVHTRLVIYSSDALQGVLPSGLRARVEESVLLETPAGLGDHPLFPDVRVVEYASKRNSEAQGETGVALAEPLLIQAEPEPVTEPFIEIIDRESGNRVVTVIEFLSPSNKSPGPNREQYLHKQRQICSSDANLVEIDLNRYGAHTLAFALENLNSRFHTAYMACIRRPTRPGMAEVYRMPLWERLPVLKIPLRPTDADVPLDLQAVVDQCYRNGAYEGTLNYAVAPEPPLSRVDEEWTKQRLQELGLRPRKKPSRRKGKQK